MFQFDGEKKVEYRSCRKWAQNVRPSSQEREDALVLKTLPDLKRILTLPDLLSVLYSLPFLIHEPLLISCPDEQTAINNFKLIQLTSPRSVSCDVTCLDSEVIYCSPDLFVQLLLSKSPLLTGRKVFYTKLGEEIQKLFGTVTVQVQILDADTSVPVPRRFSEASELIPKLYPLSNISVALIQNEFRKFKRCLSASGDTTAFKIHAKTILAGAAILDSGVQFLPGDLDSQGLSTQINCFWDYMIFEFQNSSYDRLVKRTGGSGPSDYLYSWCERNGIEYENAKAIFRLYYKILDIFESTYQENVALQDMDFPRQYDNIPFLQASVPENNQYGLEDDTITGHSRIFENEGEYLLAALAKVERLDKSII